MMGSNIWKTKHVITESALERANTVKTWIENVLPPCSTAIIMRDDYDSTPLESGTLLIACFIDNNAATPELRDGKTGSP